MPSAFSDKVNQLPKEAKDLLLSNLPAIENFRISTSYGLDESQIGKAAQMIGSVFVGEIDLENLPEILKMEMNIKEGDAYGLASGFAKGIFMQAPSYFPGAKDLAQKWGGLAAPPTKPAQKLEIEEEIETETEEAAAKKEKEDAIVELTIRQLIDQGRAEVFNQKLTGTAIKEAGTQNLLKPTLKNWLLDYKHYKSQFDEGDAQLLRLGYLYKSENGRNLTYENREVINAVIKSFDEGTKLPIYQESGRIAIEKLVSKLPEKTQPQAISYEPAAKHAFKPPAQPAAAPSAPPRPQIQPQQPPMIQPQQRPVPPRIAPPEVRPVSRPNFRPAPPAPAPVARPEAPRQNNPYRETIMPEDLAGPEAAKKPAPKLDGNVIDLKEYGNR